MRKESVRAPEWDGISLEILRSGLVATCEEILSVLIRSGHSVSLRERQDCSAAIYAHDGSMVVQAEHIPVHMGVMARVMRVILQEFPRERMRPGDCFITNDPYLGHSNHLPDFMVSGPIFMHGELVGFAATLGHHSDVGGATPRSMPGTATEIFQEGLRIPPVQISRSGQVDEGLLRVLRTNSRTPGEVEADLLAQIGAVALAQRRIAELENRHGSADFQVGLNQLMDRSEAAMRQRLRELPDGEWVGESTAEDGESDHRIIVKVVLEEDELRFDFEGTAAQSRGAFNATLANTESTILTAVRNVIGFDVPPNAGLYRPLSFRIPTGTIINPRPTAAISATTQVSYHTYEALMRGLAEVVPENVVSDSGAGGVFSWGGVHPKTGAFYAYGEAIGGGFGAMDGLAGENAVMPPVSQLYDTPTEALEMLIPVLIEEYGLVECSGGRGEYPGGEGIRRTIRVLGESTWSVQPSMTRKQPAGLAGGGPGRSTVCYVDRVGGQRIAVDRFMAFEAEPGDLFVIETAGGAGYGAEATNE